jgi:hypothetical protein
MSFHYNGSPRREQHHSWRFRVLTAHHVVRGGGSGDFPPQFAM